MSTTSSLTTGPAKPKTLATLWRWLRVVLIAFVVLDAIMIVAILVWNFHYRQLHRQSVDQLFRYFQYAMGLVLQAALLVADFLFARYLFRAMKTARLIAPEARTISPGWAVGWNFVPFANLWKPFEAVQQIWRISQPEGASRLHWTMFAWWGGWNVYWFAVICLRVIGYFPPAWAWVRSYIGLDFFSLNFWLAVAADLGLGLSVLFSLVWLSKLTRAQDLELHRHVFA